MLPELLDRQDARVSRRGTPELAVRAAILVKRAGCANPDGHKVMGNYTASHERPTPVWGGSGSLDPVGVAAVRRSHAVTV
jgi:hypothetical protein